MFGGLPAEKDLYLFDRMIRHLVDEGFGSYEEAASADVIEAAVFLFLKHDVRSHVMDLLTRRN